MIEVDIQKDLGAFRIDAKFAVPARGVTALFGRSGAGKTTLVNLIAGLERPDAGRITVQDQVLYDSTQGIALPVEKRHLGYIFQEGRLFPHMSVERNLTYGMPGGSTADEKKATLGRIVDMLGIEKLLERRPATLSGGEKQRVAIGRALLSDPKILLMDEPLASLDAARKDEILSFIEHLSGTLALPVIYVSHAMDEIIRLADTLILLSEGTVAAAGDAEEIMNRLDLRPLTGRYEAGAVLEATVEGHETEEGLTRLTFAGGTLRVPAIDMPAGRTIRLRIRSRDVSLALTPPENISILNVLKGVIREIGQETGPQRDIVVDVGTPIWARITAHSVRRLGLVPGTRVHVLIKSIAIDSRSLGHRPQAGAFRPSEEPEAAKLDKMAF